MNSGLSGQAGQATKQQEPRTDGTDEVYQADGVAEVADESPATVALEIGNAVRATKHGLKVRRPGWNSKGMYVFYQRGYPEGIGINQNTADATGLKVGTVCKFQPYLMMRTADGSFIPWLASQADILAQDWEIVPDNENEAQGA